MSSCSHNICTQDRPRQKRSGWLMLADSIALLGLIFLFAAGVLLLLN